MPRLRRWPMRRGWNAFWSATRWAWCARACPAPWACSSTPWPTTAPAWPGACTGCRAAPGWWPTCPTAATPKAAGRPRAGPAGWCTVPTVEFLVQRGVPVCAHLGLTPQSVHALGGYRVQGKTDAGARTLRQPARELQAAGAALLVLEMVPAALARDITDALPHCPTIGIGAGNGTAGQVLVLHDMLGMNLGKMPRFVHNFMQDAGSVHGAIAAYVQAVKQGRFPDNALHAW